VCFKKRRSILSIERRDPSALVVDNTYTRTTSTTRFFSRSRKKRVRNLLVCVSRTYGQKACVR
jgi:hypothetical protein